MPNIHTTQEPCLWLKWSKLACSLLVGFRHDRRSGALGNGTAGVKGEQCQKYEASFKRLLMNSHSIFSLSFSLKTKRKAEVDWIHYITCRCAYLMFVSAGVYAKWKNLGHTEHDQALLDHEINIADCMFNAFSLITLNNLPLTTGYDKEVNELYCPTLELCELYPCCSDIFVCMLFHLWQFAAFTKNRSNGKCPWGKME